MPSYCFYLFGAPRIERDSQSLAIPRRKGTALLAYLAVTAQAHSREALATMFWPEFDRSSEPCSGRSRRMNWESP